MNSITGLLNLEDSDISISDINKSKNNLHPFPYCIKLLPNCYILCYSYFIIGSEATISQKNFSNISSALFF